MTPQTYDQRGLAGATSAGPVRVVRGAASRRSVRGATTEPHPVPVVDSPGATREMARPRLLRGTTPWPATPSGAGVARTHLPGDGRRSVLPPGRR